MPEVYVIAVHKRGELAPVGIARDEKEAREVAEVFSKYGRVLMWKAEEVYPHSSDEVDSV